MKKILLSSLLLLAAFAMPESMRASDFYKSTLMTTGNITNSAIKSGTASYDAETATLTLDNVVVDSSNWGAIWLDSDTPAMTIKLIGDNVLHTNACGLYLNGCRNVLLTSDCGGKLTIESKDEGIYYAKSQEGTLTIKDCSVTISSNSYGISGYLNGANSQSFNITVDNSTVITSGAPTRNTIQNLKTLQLIDCHISQPAGAVFGFDADHYRSSVYVVENDKMVAVKETVIIVPGEGEAPVLETCEEPVISIKDGKIVATTATEGATCHISYSFTGASTGSANTECGLPNVKMEINAYASAPGKNPSTTASKTFDYSFGPKGDVSGDGVLSVEDVTKLVDELLNK